MSCDANSQSQHPPNPTFEEQVRGAEAEVLRAAAEQRAEELGEAAQTPPRRPRKSESLDAEYEQVMAMLSPMQLLATLGAVPVARTPLQV